MFSKISIVSSTEVGSTKTFWNLLSSAPSFSMYCLYSSNVVAPTHCISPRASAGLNILLASKDPVAPPAPTMVCISSIKRMISLFFSSSFIRAFMRSSNCPRYFVPATKLAKSRVTTRLSYKMRDTFLCMIRSARPSAMADLPTPGSPIKSGLFFLRLLKICDTLCISASRPTTGSNFPRSAIWVRSLPKLSKTGVLDFLFVLTPGLPNKFSLEGSCFSDLSSSAKASSADGISMY